MNKVLIFLIVYTMVKDLGMDDYVASELNYNENYTKKQLELIADYYNISKRKKKKI